MNKFDVSLEWAILQQGSSIGSEFPQLPTNCPQVTIHHRGPFTFFTRRLLDQSIRFLAVQTNQTRENEKHKDNDKRTHKFPRGSNPPPVFTFYIHIETSSH